MHGSCSCSCDHGVAGERVTVEFIASQLWPQNLPYLNPILYSIWGILWEKVYQTCIVDFGELKCRLNLEWTRLDHASNAGILCQWHCSLLACIEASSGHFEFCFRLKHFVVVVDEWNGSTLTSLCYLAFCPFWRYSDHFISQGKIATLIRWGGHYCLHHLHPATCQKCIHALFPKYCWSIFCWTWCRNGGWKVMFSHSEYEDIFR